VASDPLVPVPAPGDLTGLASRWAGLRVLVLGDALLDGWLIGRPERLCREAPIAVVGLDETSYAGGGAANTAVNLAALGATASLIGAVGDDPSGARLRECLSAAGVRDRLVSVPDRRTAVKNRVMADAQIIARMDEGDTGPLPARATQSLIASWERALSDGVDAVVVCDYAAGTLDPRVRDRIVRTRHRLDLLVVDAHDLAPWAEVRPDLVTPSFTEVLRLIDTRVPDGTDRVGWVSRQAAALCRATGAETVAVTLDGDGTVVVERGEVVCRTKTRPVPASGTTGAGDSYVAGFTLARACGLGTPEAAEVAQLVARTGIEAAAAAGTGTVVARVEDLRTRAGDGLGLVVDDRQLADLVAAHREKGRRIVFTNGCFDVLHRGHVGYLAQASRLGDVLIVAVNSDESVRRLKGPDRPVNPIEDRAAVLAGLASVDHVVVFEEDSPSRLIALVRPDVYVKGGDYPPELIPEAPLVRRLGGEVRALGYLPDVSTSRIIERIRSGARS
jgi:D-beta-D-heptose 7-phosphate kinase/D-beta-D-heptose 1-phosphate adenosyltransferase